MLGIPTSAELTKAGEALEDHLSIQIQAVLHNILDRLSGTTLQIVNGGVKLVIPQAKDK